MSLRYYANNRGRVLRTASSSGVNTQPRAINSGQAAGRGGAGGFHALGRISGRLKGERMSETCVSPRPLAALMRFTLRSVGPGDAERDVSAARGPPAIFRMCLLD